jgi:restriction endonuclease Mrr
MPIPGYQALMLPVLRLLADGAEHTAGSAIEALSDELQLTSAEREQLVGSQRISLMASRVHWAMTYLAQAGLTDRPRRGVWRITSEGTRVLLTDPERIDHTVLERYEGFRSFISRSAGEPEVADGEAPESGGEGAESADMPSVDDLLRPILVALSDGQAHEFSAVVEAVLLLVAVAEPRRALGDLDRSLAADDYTLDRVRGSDRGDPRVL